MSSLSHFGWLSFLTLLLFKGAWLLKTFIGIWFSFSKFMLESISDMTNEFIEIESSFKNASSLNLVFCNSDIELFYIVVF